MRDAHNERLPTKKDLGSSASKLRQQLSKPEGGQQQQQLQKEQKQQLADSGMWTFLIYNCQKSTAGTGI